MLDSLVRVSRRVNENHFVRIAKARIAISHAVLDFAHSTALPSTRTNPAGTGRLSRFYPGCLVVSSVQSTVWLKGYNRANEANPIRTNLPSNFLRQIKLILTRPKLQDLTTNAQEPRVQGISSARTTRTPRRVSRAPGKTGFHRLPPSNFRYF